MHILQIADGHLFSTYGGRDIYVHNIVDELLQHNVTLTILTENIRKETYKGCKLYNYGGLDDEQIFALVKEISPDVIHAHYYERLFCIIGRQLGIPVVVTAHGGHIVCPAGILLNYKDEICQLKVNHKNCLHCYLRNIRTGLLWYPFMRLLPERTYLRLGLWLKKKPFIYFITPIGGAALAIRSKQEEWHNIIDNCKLMIAPSEAMKEAIVSNGLDPKKIKVIPHGIPLLPHTVPFPSTANGIQFFYLGRICYNKGLHILLEAFHQLADTNSKLHIIGAASTKAEQRYFSCLQRRYRQDCRIIWHGKILSNEVYNTVRNYHVSLMASFSDSFGLNIAESLSMGKPVLATRNGGAEMQIEDGVNGWLVPTNDVKAMWRKMEEIVRIPEAKLAQMAGKKEVVSIKRHCKELIRIYDEAITN